MISPSTGSLPCEPLLRKYGLMTDQSLFRHVFLTRFSVRFTPDLPAPDEDWLAYRLAFFADATVSSMRSQSVRPDAWLVFCDESAPEWVREELEVLGNGVFSVVWLDRPWGRQVLIEAVSAVADRPYLITTRLDSDDALGVDFVSLVQAQFESQTEMYVNLLRGLQVDRSQQVFRYDYPENPFISLIEHVEGAPKTVFRSSHPECHFYAQVRNVVTAPSWLQVVHGTNIDNEIRGPRAKPELVAANFDIDLPYEQQVGFSRFTLQLIASWSRLLLLWCRQPRLAKQYFVARHLHRRGTATLPQRQRRSPIRIPG